LLVQILTLVSLIDKDQIPCGGDFMDPLTGLKLADLRQQDLAVDASRARLAAEARRVRRQRAHSDWRARIARR
jgi:hypothetical protein